MRISKYAIYEFILFHFFVFLYVVTFPYKDIWSVTAFLALLVLLLLVLEYLRTRLFVTPLFFWFAFWLGAIVLGRMHLTEAYPIYQEWGDELLRLVVINTVVFYWVYLLGERARGDFADLPDWETIGAFRYERLADLVIGMLAIAIAAFVLNVIHTGVIPQLSGDANAYREAFRATRFYQIVTLLRFSLLLVPPAVKNTESLVKKLAVICLTGGYLLAEMLSGWRGYTLQAMILLATSWFLFSDVKNENVRKRNLLFGSFGVAAILVFIVVVTVTRDSTFDSLVRRARYAVENFYLYVAPNFLNVQSAMEKVQPKGTFLYTTEIFWGIFRKPWEIPQYIYSDIEYSIGAYNVCTYLLEPYCDLGLPGTMVWSAIIAFFSGEAFGRCRRNPSGFFLVLLGIMNITIFYLHNNFFLRSTTVLLWLAAGGVIGLWITRQKETEENGSKVL
ncbi:MAG: oligosaccharide repeat unit polymerase [Oscillospiraceae bacterium]|nr:oligosaccharide repeat unit polymerase [Oscillospiraceae bacterium]